MNAKLAAILLCIAAVPCWADDAQPLSSPPTTAPQATAPEAAPPPPAPAASAAAEATQPGEPNVQHIVIEDKGSRIDELKVRGTTQRVTVTPKIITGKSYEIIMGDGSRNLTFSANSSRGAAGQSVWNVLNF